MYTYWDEQLGSYLLTKEHLKLKERDLINIIGEIEHKPKHDSQSLDDIRAEIDKIYEREGSSFDCLNALDELKEFIDKLKEKSEE